MGGGGVILGGEDIFPSSTVQPALIEKRPVVFRARLKIDCTGQKSDKQTVSLQYCSLKLIFVCKNK